MIDFEFDRKCYSCSACGEVCPTGAITYDIGLHPIVDVRKCIHCNVCDNVCVELKKPKTINGLLKNSLGIVAKNNDENIRKNSSSGGVFFQIAKCIINDGGYVCGCVFDDYFMPMHIVTNELEQVEKMLGSKYVQSDLKNCINEIKKLLKKGKKVLFSGTPCQTAAIKKCIVNESKNLIVVSVVCHGTIERRIWNQYLQEEAGKKKIVDVSMRDKSQGWLNYGLKFRFSDGTERVKYRKRTGYFLKCYTDGLFEKERCLSCEFKGDYINSDLLLGDAWGMEDKFPELVGEYGASVVLILTEKGNKIFAKIKNNIQYEKVDVSKIIQNNKRIVSPAPENPLRNKFYKKINSDQVNICKLCELYGKNTIINRIKKKVLILLKKAF